MNFLRNNGYAYEAGILSTYNIIVDERNGAEYAWGQNLFGTIIVSNDAFDLNSINFASLLLHEANHSFKIAPNEDESFEAGEAFLLKYQPSLTTKWGSADYYYLLEHKSRYYSTTGKESKVKVNGQ